MANQEKSGCKTLDELWQVALDCNINSPGIIGTPGRVVSFIQCKNIRDFMVMATMKCWQEKNYKDMPPIILVDKKVIDTGNSSSVNSKSSNKT